MKPVKVQHQGLPHAPQRTIETIQLLLSKFSVTFLQVFENLSKFPILFLRLRRAYEKVTADHWLNVTQEDLIGNDLIQGGSTLIPPGTRNGTTPAKIFWKIFSDELLDHIVEASNANARTQHANKRGRPSTVDKEDIRKLIAMQVDICAYGYDNFTEYLRSPNENIGLSQREYERVRHVLDFNTEEFFNLFNVALKTLVNVFF